LADISNFGHFFATNDMANDFLISYQQQAKNEISAEISTNSVDVYNRGKYILCNLHERSILLNIIYMYYY